MKRVRWIQALFWLAAVYDGVLGVAFMAAPVWVYDLFKVTPPNHLAYVQFPAALLVIFALMFIAIARNPKANRNLMPYGMGLKVAYCTVAFAYWLAEGIPCMWKPFVFADVVMLILFLWSYIALDETQTATAQS